MTTSVLLCSMSSVRSLIARSPFPRRTNVIAATTVICRYLNTNRFGSPTSTAENSNGKDAESTKRKAKANHKLTTGGVAMVETVRFAVHNRNETPIVHTKPILTTDARTFSMSPGQALRQSCIVRSEDTQRRHLCTERSAPMRWSTRTGRRSGDELAELRARGEVAVGVDSVLRDVANAAVFPRIKTTSLSTKRVVIHDECAHASATLVLLAFRRYADGQLESWRSPFINYMQDRVAIDGRQSAGQFFDVTVNETFATQALSGFVQRIQRSSIHTDLHDYYVAFNDRIRKPIEDLLPIQNRLYGFALLLDSKGRVRFKGAGFADCRSQKALLAAVGQLVEEDAQAAGSR